MTEKRKLPDVEVRYLMAAVEDYKRLAAFRPGERARFVEDIEDRALTIREYGFQEGLDHAANILTALFKKAAGEAVNCPVCGGPDGHDGRGPGELYFDCRLCASSDIHVISDVLLVSIFDDAIANSEPVAKERPGGVR